MGRKQQVRLNVPSLVVMLKRWMFDLLFMIAFTAFSLLIILGQNTFWTLDLVNTLYARAGTNEFAVWIFVWVTGFVLNCSLMILWNTGILGYLNDWIENA